MEGPDKHCQTYAYRRDADKSFSRKRCKSKIFDRISETHVSSLMWCEISVSVLCGRHADSGYKMRHDNCCKSSRRRWKYVGTWWWRSVRSSWHDPWAERQVGSSSALLGITWNSCAQTFDFVELKGSNNLVVEKHLKGDSTLDEND